MINTRIEISVEKLYKFASDKNELLELEFNIRALYFLFEQCFELRSLFKTQRLERAQKVALILEMPCFKKSVAFSELIKILIFCKLYSKIPSLYNRFSRLLASKSEKITVEITTVAPMDSKSQESITAQLEKEFNNKVLVKNLIDQSLIGGMIIKYPSGKIFDFSLNRKLNDLKYHLSQRGI